MEIDFFKNIPAKIVNLDSRLDRWSNVVREMEKIGIKNYTRFPGITRGGAWAGSVESHFQCVVNGSGALLVFEDDVAFEPNVNDILPHAVSQLPDDFDLFYLGANVKQPSHSRYSENLFKVICGVHTNHAILFSDNARNIIRTHYNENLVNGVFNFSSYSSKYVTFDHWLFSYGQAMMNSYVCYPLVAFQSGGRSDVRGEDLDAIYRSEMLKNQTLHMQ